MNIVSLYYDYRIMLSKFYRHGFRFICLYISVRLGIRCIKYKYDYLKYKKLFNEKVPISAYLLLLIINKHRCSKINVAYVNKLM